MGDADLYQRAIVDAARSAEQYPRLVAPTGSATIDNPLCGDRVTIDVRMHGPTLLAIGQRVRGCLLCEASSALIARHAVGHERGDLRALLAKVSAMLKASTDDEAKAAEKALGPPWEELTTFFPVRPYKSRHECVLLPFEALGKALD